MLRDLLIATGAVTVFLMILTAGTILVFLVWGLLRNKRWIAVLRRYRHADDWMAIADSIRRHPARGPDPLAWAERQMDPEHRILADLLLPKDNHR